MEAVVIDCQNLSHWDERYVMLAKHVSAWSKDPSTKVGAVVIGERGQPLSFSYNGLPRRVQDTRYRLNDRAKKYAMIVHAELNAIYNASLSGTTLRGSTMYVWGLPTCNECAKGVIQSGIVRVVMAVPEGAMERSPWRESFAVTRLMFEEAGVSYDVVEFDSEAVLRRYLQLD